MLACVSHMGEKLHVLLNRNGNKSISIQILRMQATSFDLMNDTSKQTKNPFKSYGVSQTTLNPRKSAYHRGSIQYSLHRVTAH